MHVLCMYVCMGMCRCMHACIMYVCVCMCVCMYLCVLMCVQFYATGPLTLYIGPGNIQGRISCQEGGMAMHGGRLT